MTVGNLRNVEIDENSSRARRFRRFPPLGARRAPPKSVANPAATDSPRVQRCRLRLHWAHGSVMDAELWKKISPPGSETWRQYDAPYSLVLVDERAIPAEQLGTHETFFQVDCADYGGLRRACEGVDTVVHLGAVAQEEMMAHVHEPDAFHLSMLRPCILQAFNVFHAATDAGCRRVVYASSAHSVAGNVYGRHSAREGVETDDDVPTYKLVRGMTVGQVGQWLKSIGFEEYKYTFQRHQVDGTVLCRFRQQDDGGLMIMKRDLDIAHLGHRNRILEALESFEGAPGDGGAGRATAAQRARRCTHRTAWEAAGRRARPAPVAPSSRRTRRSAPRQRAGRARKGEGNPNTGSRRARAK